MARSDTADRGGLWSTLSTQPGIAVFEVDARGDVVRAEGSVGGVGGAPATWVGRSLFEVWGDAPTAVAALRRALGGEACREAFALGSASFQVNLALRPREGGGVIGMLFERVGGGPDVAPSERREGAEWAADARSLKVHFISPKLLTLLGYSAQQWLGGEAFWSKVLVPEERDLVLARFRSTARDGHERTSVHRAMTSDGRVRWLSTTVRPSRWLADGVDEISGRSEDVTQREGAPQPTNNEAITRLVLNQLPGVVWSVDAKLRFTGGGGAGLLALGVSNRDLLGRSLYEYLQTDDPNHPVIRRVRKVLETREAEAYESTWLDRHYDNYLEPFKDDSGEHIGVLCISFDITARKKADETLLQTQEQLRQAQKMEAIGRMAGGVAHDFNNLLSVIGCYAGFLQSRLSGDATGTADLEEIQKATERAADLTRQLLAFSRQQVLAARIVDLNASLESTVKMLSRILGEEIELTLEPDRTIGHVKVDPGQLEQVILNLVVNARDAMPQGGSLRVSTHECELRGARAKEGEVSPGRYVVLRVQDSGSGMDEETKKRLFEPFFTTKEPGRGTGLGLATVFGIVRQSGGTIFVATERSKGTTFDVLLPRIETPLDRPVPEAVISGLARGHETVLLVEDDAQVRALMKNILERSGYQVLVAADPAAAERTSEAHREAIALVVTDMRMPTMSGPQLADRLRARRPNMRVLFVSGYAAPDSLRAVSAERAIDFLAKPFSPEQLTARVRAAIDAHEERALPSTSPTRE